MAELKIDLVVDNKGSVQIQKFAIDVEQSFSRINGAASSAGNAADKAINKAASSTSNFSSSLNRASNDMMSFGSVAKTALGAFSAYELVQFGKSVVDTVVHLDSLNRSFVAIAGNQHLATKEMEYMREVSAATGQNLYKLADDYRQLTASTKGSALEGEKTRDVFLALNEASAVLGLSSERLSLAIRAIGQMASKGTVQMEELKNQLGDHIPGAVQITARALGVSTKQLYDMSAAGELLAENVIPALSKELHNLYGEAARTAALESGQAAVNKLSESWTEFKASLADNDAVVSSLRLITATLQGLAAVMNGLRNQSAGMFAGEAMIAEAAASGVENATKLISKSAETSSNISKLKKQIDDLNASIAVRKEHGIDYDYERYQLSLVNKELSQQEAIFKKITGSPYITGEAAGKIDVVSGAYGKLMFKMQGVRAETEKEREASEKAHESSVRWSETRSQSIDREYRAALAGARTDEERAAATRKYNAEKTKLAEQEAKAQERKNRAGEREAKQFNDALNSLLPLRKEQEQYAKDVATLNAALSKGVITQEEYSQGLVTAERRMASYQAKLREQRDTAETHIDLLKLLGMEEEAYQESAEARLKYGEAVNAETEEYLKQIDAIKLAIIARKKLDDISRQSYANKTESAQIEADLSKVDGSSIFTQIEAEKKAALAAAEERYQIERDLQKRIIEERSFTVEAAKANAKEIANAEKALANNEARYAYESLKAEKEAAGAKMAAYSSFAGYGADALESLAAMQDKSSKEGFESAKKMSLAAAIMSTAAGIMNQFSSGDPYTAFARAAAVAAAGVVQIDTIKATEYGGGGGSISAPTSISSGSGGGTGVGGGQISTVLGAPEGTASKSVERSLKLLEDTYDVTKTRLTGIYEEIKALNNNITGLVTGIIRTGGITTDGMNIDLSGKEGFGSSVASKLIDPLSHAVDDILGAIWSPLGGMFENLVSDIFGGSVKNTVMQQGLHIGDTSVQSLLDGNDVTVLKWANVKSVKDGGMFGSDKTKWYDYLSAIDQDVTDMVTMVFVDIGNTLVAVAEGLGTDVEAAKRVYLKGGRINLKDMSGAQMEEALNDYFSWVADQAAYTLFNDSIGQYQKLDEGLLETAVRLITEADAITTALELTGQTFAGTKLEVIAFAEEIIGLAGSLDSFSESVINYYDKFYSDAEKQARAQETMSRVMGTVGKDLPSSRAGYRDIIEGLDLTTDAGKQAYVTLLSLSELSDAYYSYLEDVAEERLNLEIELMQLLGDEEGALAASRQKELAAMDATLKPLQQMIWALEDEAAAISKQAEAIITAFGDVEGAMKEINPEAKKLVDSWRENKTALQDLISGLADAMGEVPEATALEALRKTMDELKSVADGIANINDAIYELQTGKNSEEAIRIMKQREQSLWALLQTTDDPAGVSGKLAQTITDRIKMQADLEYETETEIAKLAQEARQKEIDALKEQIDNAEALIDVIAEIKQYVSELKFSDLSALNYTDQLGAAKSNFSGLLQRAMGGDIEAANELQGAAGGYLQEAQQYYGGATSQYAAIYNSVVAALEQYGNSPVTDIDLLQSQLDKLEAIEEAATSLETIAADTTDEQIAALKSINAALQVREDALEKQRDDQKKAVEDQIEQLQTVVTNQEAQIRQQAEIYADLQHKLENMQEVLDSIDGTASLEATQA